MLKRSKGSRFLAALLTGILATISTAGLGAAEATEYPTRDECMDATLRACFQTDHGTWVPSSDPGSGGESVSDPEFLARTGRSMPTNISGTLQHPVVAVDFERVSFPDVQPVLDATVGRVRVPIRFISEKMGARVTWLQESWTVVIEREGLMITLQIDNPVYTVNGELRTLDAPPIILEGRTMVPLRAIAEMFGATVDWVGDQPPAADASYIGKYQVWIWIPWGYWGTTGLETRLQTSLYRRN